MFKSFSFLASFQKRIILLDFILSCNHQWIHGIQWSAGSLRNELCFTKGYASLISGHVRVLHEPGMLRKPFRFCKLTEAFSRNTKQRQLCLHTRPSKLRKRLEHFQRKTMQLDKFFGKHSSDSTFAHSPICSGRNTLQLLREGQFMHISLLYTSVPFRITVCSLCRCWNALIHFPCSEGLLNSLY